MKIRRYILVDGYQHAFTLQTETIKGERYLEIRDVDGSKVPDGLDFLVLHEQARKLLDGVPMTVGYLFEVKR